MKIKLVILIITLLAIWNIGFSQHIPECGGNAHTGGNCRGYAVGLAYNLDWNLYGDCNPRTLGLSALPSNSRFAKHINRPLNEILTSVNTLDLIGWDNGGTHAVFGVISRLVISRLVTTNSLLFIFYP